MSTSKTSLIILIIALAVAPPVGGGPALAVGCVAACNAGAVACYGALGAVFGTVTAGAGTPAAILACNTALSACMALCAGSVVAPTP
uniref:Cysteine-rich protein n=1 Tax=Plectus sambesii TaxID=2011161 RepID=A0A914WS65_9BILA